MEKINKNETLTKREFFSLIEGMKSSDRQYIYKYVATKSETEFVYRHTFNIISVELENQNDEYGDIEIIEKITHHIQKVKKTSNIRLGISHNSQLYFYLETEEIDKETLFLIEENLIQRINSRICEYEEQVKDLQRAIKSEKKFLKNEFKDFYRIKKIKKIINDEEKI